MNAHFFDLNTAINVNSEVWIVSKSDPNKPILKISQSEFNLIKKSVYKNTGQSITINEKEYWVTDELIDKIKIRCKNLKIDITTLAFSMKEFMSSDLIKNLDYKIWKEHFVNLKNSDDDIYFICSKNTKKNYEFLIEKLETYLKEELGLKVKNYYFITETFYNRDEDKISHKKVRLLLQHLIGLKTDSDKFTNEEITQYDKISFYDDELNTINLSKNINDVLKFTLSNSDPETKKKVEDLIKSKKISLEINMSTYNKVNMFVKTTVDLSIDRIIKTYERFINKF